MAASWDRIETLFFAALERMPAARAAFLMEACADDPDLRREVEEMLVAHEEGGSLHIEERLLAGASPQPPDPESLVGARVGPYHLRRLLGRGGMGAVYLAERADGQYEQRVALKLIRPGLHSVEIAARFRMERQILAQLVHPNIAHLTDGGMTGDGRPYLVMQYVEGIPITTYCDAHRLSIEQRLRLFATVCAAVQFAHRNMVVHRDLKPSNILVTEEGVVKLLDFGIAKLLDAEAAEGPMTRADVRVMTPEYAAPEQIRGEAITTATDVYALGVLLYELLTGHRPYPLSRRSGSSVERVICEEDPPRPSLIVTNAAEPEPSLSPEAVSAARRTPLRRLRRQLRGDLDNMVMMALRKEPARRYASAGQFAEDIERYLTGRPVIAQRDTLEYRLRKFVRRHRAGVATAAAFVLLLLSFSVVTLLQARTVARQRDLAQAERDKAEQVAQMLIDLFKGSDPTGARGGGITAREILDEGAEKIRRELQDQPETQARMLSIIGQVYRSLGLYDRARSALEDAVARYRQRGSRSLDFATGLKELANLRIRLEDLDAAEPLLREALTLLASHDSSDTERASLLNSLALVLEGQGRTDEARITLQRAIEIRRRVLGDEPDENLAANLNNLANMLQDNGELEEAEQMYEEALAMVEAIRGPEHPYVAFTLNSLASLHQERGNFERAEAEFRRALRIGAAFFPEDHPFLAVVHHNLGKLYEARGDFPGAAAAYERALALRRRALPDAHPDVSASLIGLGRVRLAMGRASDAVALLREALDIRRTTYADDDWRTAQAEVHLGRGLLELGRYVEAEPLLLHGHRISLEQRGAGNAQTELARRALVGLYSALGQPEKAAPFRTPPAP
jgi:serine/threonine-protein kinase